MESDTHWSLVTIRNYNTYQPMEPSSVDRELDRQRTGIGQPKDTYKNEKNIKNVKKTSKPLPPEASRLGDVLANLIFQNNPKHSELNGKRESTIARWADDIDKLNRLDGQSWEDIERIIAWSQADDFWKLNILSGKKLREKFNQLMPKANATTQARVVMDDPSDPLNAENWED